ncbi:MAG: hypothetical protein HKO65_09425 [Gemmatimonadetes bacterium]|nr:hypothetical protein [Gemmatimonadota bacterium]
MGTRTIGFELDHFFVAVSGPAVGATALRETGFLEGAPNTHTGQGTASRGVLFESVYLELIWLTDAEEAASPTIRRTRLADRVGPGAEACPFGLGLRGVGTETPELPFPTWDYRPPYLPEGMSFQMGSSSEVLTEPLVFFLPWLSGPAWTPQEHPNGARRVTKITMILDQSALNSPTVSALSDAGIASFQEGNEYFMDVELDGAGSGKGLDLRPDIPIRLRW